MKSSMEISMLFSCSLAIFYRLKFSSKNIFVESNRINLRLVKKTMKVHFLYHVQHKNWSERVYNYQATTEDSGLGAKKFWWKLWFSSGFQWSKNLLSVPLLLFLKVLKKFYAQFHQSWKHTASYQIYSINNTLRMKYTNRTYYFGVDPCSY